MKLFLCNTEHQGMQAKNTVQALKYPLADAVTIYMPGFKAINWK